MFVLAVAAALQFGGCGVGSYQTCSIDLKNSPFVNPGILMERTDDQALYRYQKPWVNLKKYNKIMLDPVLVMKDGELNKDEMADYQKLANNAYVYLVKELEKDYKMLQAPEPGALRIQVAIIDADDTKPVRNTLSTLAPIGSGLSLARYTATGKLPGVGKITAEMKVTDATTGELLVAAFDRRVGDKEISGLWSKWHNVDDALQYCAKRTSFILCNTRGGTNCVNP